MTLRRLLISVAVFGLVFIGGVTTWLTWADHQNHKYDSLPDTQDLKARIDKLGREHLQQCPDSALVIGVYQHGKRFVQGFGKVSAENPNTPDEHTMFEIGSVTKVFTATILAQLVANHELNVDDPISDHLPKNVTVPTKNGREITLVHLATHTSGLPRMPGNFREFVRDEQKPYINYYATNLYADLATVKLAMEPGKKSNYSNYGFGLLGLILELKSGKPYEKLVKETVCAPVGLTNTVITLSPEQIKRLAKGHGPQCRPIPNWNFVVMAPAGALRSDAVDMLKFVEANLTTQTNSLSMVLADTHKVHFKGFMRSVGLGWQIEPGNEPTVYWHNGATGGYRSFVAFDKSNDVGIVVLSSFAAEADSLGMDLLNLSGKISLE